MKYDPWIDRAQTPIQLQNEALGAEMIDTSRFEQQVTKSIVSDIWFAV